MFEYVKIFEKDVFFWIIVFEFCIEEWEREMEKFLDVLNE